MKEKITWLQAVGEQLEASGCVCVRTTPVGEVVDWSRLNRQERREPRIDGLMKAVILKHRADCPLGEDSTSA